jgi:hypothetical protein
MAKSRGSPGRLSVRTESSAMVRPLSGFCSYAHRDEKHRKELDKHLSPLRRTCQIDLWNDREIVPGTDVHEDIDRHLASSDLVLLLISSDFLASDYCYRREMQYAIKRHLAGAARVIPIILRPCDWQDTPIGRLLALPKDGKPIVNWQSRDQAFLDVARGVRKAVQELVAKPPLRYGEPA